MQGEDATETRELDEMLAIGLDVEIGVKCGDAKDAGTTIGLDKNSSDKPDKSLTMQIGLTSILNMKFEIIIGKLLKLLKDGKKSRSWHLRMLVFDWLCLAISLLIESTVDEGWSLLKSKKSLNEEINPSIFWKS